VYVHTQRRQTIAFGNQKGLNRMKLSINFLPAVALTMALASFAAQAQAATQTANGGSLTVVQSGPVNQMFPASVGG
jgi:hypothetical protein